MNVQLYFIHERDLEKQMGNSGKGKFSIPVLWF